MTDLIGRNDKFTFLSWFYITIGTLLSAFGYAIFILPLNLFEGGVTGIGIIIAKLIGNSFFAGNMPPIVGIISWVLTIVIFVVSIRILGKSFGAKSVYSTTLLYFSMDIILFFLQKSGYAKKIQELLGHELLVAAIYGAIFIGTGMALVFNQGAATGGADALAQMIRRLRHIPVGKSMLLMDSIVLSLGFFTFSDFMTGFRTMMYSFIFVYMQARTLDAVLNGFSANHLITIITEEPEVIKKAIVDQLSRGMTMYESVGGFSGSKKTTISTVVSKKQVPIVRKLIAQSDPESFVIIQQTDQVYGKGFEKLPDL
ncbi:MAG: YitT family protein [Candidatus Rifleibacteriota bacterium]